MSFQAFDVGLLYDFARLVGRPDLCLSTTTTLMFTVMNKPQGNATVTSKIPSTIPSAVQASRSKPRHLDSLFAWCHRTMSRAERRGKNEFD